MARTPLRRRLSFDEVGSTNTLALEAARSGDPGPLWVTARHQTAGRGRRGRTWVSRDGNLYASLLLVDPAPLERLATLPLVAALGVRNGIAALPRAEPTSVRIKWPNDILIGGRKMVGILVESERLSDGRIAAVVGCGVNVADMPSGTPYGVTSLRAERIDADFETTFAAVATAVESTVRTWNRGEGFAPIRRDWLAHAIGIGDACRVNLPASALEGEFQALDDGGRLILGLADGTTRAISAGELFFPHLEPSGAGA
ncbi:biotin--[acetyl-CoA-carboxylase] ligase [Mangrovicella endophytica]|uniref:biotin--[acetyl-CoA-carboxylase] ligase n=1 Tax=Mangrovicella endophytica TaxID=2066697 RepID=UPI000C9DBFC3|nr:biotin--[acetyl-CoA-carboxylase] ligase [Mangrovicella endophytica]